MRISSNVSPKTPKKDYARRPELDAALPDPNSSLYLMMQKVGRRKDVLDVGCATGYFAKLLSSNDCSVVGVESNPDAAMAAQDSCTRVYTADLDFVSLTEAVGGMTFDVIVFGDVLEHLREPARVLDEARALLRAEGYVVASIPNVAHGAIRLSLLGGNFNYQNLGILDDSHLRFFTLKTIDELFVETGYTINDIERTKVPMFHDSNLLPRISRDDFSDEVVDAILRDPEADTLQFIVRAMPLSDEEKLRNITRRFVEANTVLAGAALHNSQKDAQSSSIAKSTERSSPPSPESVNGLAAATPPASAVPAALGAVPTHTSDHVMALHREIVKLVAEFSELRERVGIELAATKDESEVAKSHAAAIQAELDRVTAVVASHEATAATSARRFADLKRQISSLVQQRNNLKGALLAETTKGAGELEELERQIGGLKAECDGLKSELPVLRNESQERAQRLAELLQQMQAAVNERHVLTAELQNLRNELNARDLRLVELQQHADALANERNSLASELPTVRAELDRRAHRLAELQQQAGDLANERDGMASELGGVRAESEARAQRLTDLQEHADALANDRSVLASELCAVRADSESWLRRVDELQQEIGALIAERNTLLLELQNAREQDEQRAHGFHELERQIEMLLSERNAAASDVERLGKQSEQLRAAVEAAGFEKERVSAALQEVSSAEASARREIADLTRQLNVFQAEVARLSHVAAQRTREIGRLEQSRVQALEKSRAHEVSASVAQDEVASLRRDRDILAADVQQLRCDLASAAEQRSALRSNLGLVQTQLRESALRNQQISRERDEIFRELAVAKRNLDHAERLSDLHELTLQERDGELLHLRENLAAAYGQNRNLGDELASATESLHTFERNCDELNLVRLRLGEQVEALRSDLCEGSSREAGLLERCVQLETELSEAKEHLSAGEMRGRASESLARQRLANIERLERTVADQVLEHQSVARELEAVRKAALCEKIATQEYITSLRDQVAEVSVLRIVHELFVTQTEALISRAQSENAQMSILIDTAQSSHFWKFKRFLNRIRLRILHR